MRSFRPPDPAPGTPRGRPRRGSPRPSRRARPGARGRRLRPLRHGRSRAGRPPVPVTVGTVEQKTVPVSFRAIGNVEPIETVAVRARIGGELQRVCFDGGPDRPRRADRCSRSTPAPTARRSPRPRRSSPETRRCSPRPRPTSRATPTSSSRTTSPRSSTTRSRANAAALRAAVAADQATVETARLNLDYCTIRSPVAGRTGNAHRQGRQPGQGERRPAAGHHQPDPPDLRRLLGAGAAAARGDRARRAGIDPGRGVACPASRRRRPRDA